MASNGMKRAILSDILYDTDETELLTSYLQERRSVISLILRERKQKWAKVNNYVESTVMSYTGSQFKEHFRVQPAVFEKLCNELAQFTIQNGSWRCVDLQKEVLATVWLLATHESYRSVADRFNFSKGQLHAIVGSVCHALVRLKNDYISWPSNHELEDMAQQWNTHGFPGVIGAIDGTYIPIQGVTGQTRDSHICRKGFPAMHLQVMCDKQMVLTDIQTGYPGSVHDSRVLKNSDLRMHLESPSSKLPAEYHLLGDSSYPNTCFLLTPYRENGHLSCKEKKYNKLHSKTRVIVEHAIGLLKGKFRRLKYLAMGIYLEIPYVIIACCILHNFILLSNETDEEDNDLSDMEIESQINDDLPNYDRSGDLKRRNITENL